MRYSSSSKRRGPGFPTSKLVELKVPLSLETSIIDYWAKKRDVLEELDPQCQISYPVDVGVFYFIPYAVLVFLIASNPRC